MLRVSCLLLVTALAAAAPGCNAGSGEVGPLPNPAADTPINSPASTRTFVDQAAGCRFSMPEIGLRVIADHFDPSTPPVKIKHGISLSTLAGPVVRIDVWNNTEKLSLQDWFDKYQSYSINSGAVADTRAVGKTRTTAIVVDQKRSPQSKARRIVTFASGDRIFRATCFDGDDTIAMKVLEQVLDSFDAEEQP